MRELIILASFVGIYVPLLISPGVNFVLVTQSATDVSRRHSMAIALGITTGSMIWAALGVAGVGLAMAHLDWLRNSLRIFGGAYLLYTGLNIWLQTAKTKQRILPAIANTQRSPKKAYRHGLMTCVTNPKPLVFYTSVSAGLLTPDLPVWVRGAAVCLITLLSLVWHMVLATAFSNPHVQRIYKHVRHWINRITGAVLILFGIHLIFE